MRFVSFIVMPLGVLVNAGSYSMDLTFPLFVIAKIIDETTHSPGIADDHPDGTPDKTLLVFRRQEAAEEFRDTHWADCDVMQFLHPNQLADYISELSEKGLARYVGFDPKLIDSKLPSQGIDQFETPKEVVGISEDGEFAFVDGEKAGFPMDQLAVVDNPNEGDKPVVGKMPPANPHWRDRPKTDDLEPEKGVAKARFTLDEGAVVLTWPDDLSAESVEDLEYWLQGVINRARRKAGVQGSPKPR